MRAKLEIINGLRGFAVLWHHLFGSYFKTDGTAAAPLDGLAQTLPVYLVLLTAIGALSYRVIEFARWRIGGCCCRHRPSTPRPAIAWPRSSRDPSRFSGLRLCLDDPRGITAGKHSTRDQLHLVKQH
jgi:hypothetical protein